MKLRRLCIHPINIDESDEVRGLIGDIYHNI